MNRPNTWMHPTGAHLCKKCSCTAGAVHHITLAPTANKDIQIDSLRPAYEECEAVSRNIKMSYMDFVRTFKEVARHVLYSAGIRWRRPEHLKAPTRAGRFSKIYEDGVWAFGRNDVPLSGNGSSLKATENLRNILPGLINRLETQTLIDVGCGDFTWMRQIVLPCKYVGLDIVPWLVEQNIEKFGSAKRQFLNADVVTVPAPNGDLILCREMLFHLSLEDGIAALQNMLASGCSYLLLTTDRATSFNAQVDSGDFRLINLERRPYRLPEPIEKIEDDVVSKGRFIGLWRAEQVQKALGLDKIAVSSLI